MPVCACMCVQMGRVPLNSTSAFPAILCTKLDTASSGPSWSKFPDASRADTEVAKEPHLTALHQVSPEELESTSYGRTQSSLPGLSFPPEKKKDDLKWLRAYAALMLWQQINALQCVTTTFHHMGQPGTGLRSPKRGTRP